MNRYGAVGTLKPSLGPERARKNPKGIGNECQKPSAATLSWQGPQAKSGAEPPHSKALVRKSVPNRDYRQELFVAILSCICFLGSLLGTFAAETNGTRSVSQPARILLVTGIDYPGHVWRQTAPVLAEALRKDKRLEVFTVEDPQFLDSPALQKYDLVVLHFQNWQRPGPDERARVNLRRFVEGGKGMVLVHFACGAWHDEWPEFGDLAGRVWFGSDPGQGKRQHDPYGPFHVELVKQEHPIVKGMSDFDTQDELYTCLIGNHPIEVIAQARSKLDGKYYPMAFTSNYGKGRTFHCVLGHDVKALSVPAVQELYRRGCVWAASLEPPMVEAK